MHYQARLLCSYVMGRKEISVRNGLKKLWLFVTLAFHLDSTRSLSSRRGFHLHRTTVRSWKLHLWQAVGRKVCMEMGRDEFVRVWMETDAVFCGESAVCLGDLHLLC